MENCAGETEKFWNKTVGCHEATVRRRTEISLGAPEATTKCVALHVRDHRGIDTVLEYRSCTRTAIRAARRAAR
jgi:hypothetical protein